MASRAAVSLADSAQVVAHLKYIKWGDPSAALAKNGRTNLSSCCIFSVHTSEYVTRRASWIATHMNLDCDTHHFITGLTLKCHICGRGMGVEVPTCENEAQTANVKECTANATKCAIVTYSKLRNAI